MSWPCQKMNLFGKLFIYFFILSLLFNSKVICRISNERRCADAQCSKPISFARTLIRYSADDSRLLSFTANQKAKIFSKEAGDNLSFWEAEEDITKDCVSENFLGSLEKFLEVCNSGINGKRGYVPKEFLKEEKVLVRSSDLKYKLPTEDIKKTVHNTSGKTTENIGPDTSKTPELQIVNSKGLFSTIGGVSADSVPPSSPDIKPQSTKKYQVFGGTTIYDDAVSDNSETPSEQVHKIEKTPDLPSSQENSDQPPKEVYTKETPVTSSSQDNSEPSSEHSHKAEDAADATSSQDISQLSPEQVSKIETPVALSPQEVKNEENKPPTESTKTQSDKVEELSDNVERIQSETGNAESGVLSSKSSIFNTVVDTISDFMSSGIGPSEKENEKGYEDEDEEEESSGEYEENPEDGEEASKEDTSTNAAVNQSDEIKSSILQQDVSQKHININSLSDSGNVSQAPNIVHILNKDNLSNVNVLDSNPPNHMATNEDKIKLSSEESRVENEQSPDVVTESSAETVSNDSSSVILDPAINESHSFPNSEEKVLGSDTEQEDSTLLTMNDTINDVQKENVKPLQTHDLYETASKINSKEEITSDYNKANIMRSGFNKKLHNESKEEMSTEAPTEIVNQDDTVKSAEDPSTVQSSESKQPTNLDSRGFLFGQINMQNDNANKAVEESNEVLEQPEHTIVDINTKPEYTAAPNIPAVLDTSAPFQESLTEKPNFDSAVESQSTTEAVQKDYDDTSKDEIRDSVTSETSILSEQIETVTDVQDSLVEEPVETSSQEISQSADSSDDIKVAEDTSRDMVDEDSKSMEETSQIASEDEKVADNILSDTVADNLSAGIFSFLNPVFDFFRTNTISEDKTHEISSNTESSIKSQSLDPSRTSFIKDESCLAEGVGEEACDVITGVPTSKDVSWQESLYSTDMSETLDLLNKIPIETTVWLIVTAVVVLIFSLGHYYIEAHRRDGPLVASINKLERELLILKKEASIMEDRIQTYQEQLEAWNTNSTESDALIVELKQELEEIKGAKLELEDQVAVLEREVETVTESGLEMHRLLEESLSSQDGSQVLLSTVQTLREKLEHQENEITGLSQSLSRKNVEVEELQNKLEQSAESVRGLEDRIVAVTRAKEEEALQLKDSQREIMAQLEEVMETKALDETRVSAEMSKLRLAIEELQKTLAEKESELEVVKEVVKELRSTDSNDKMDALFDVVGMTAKLKAAVTERDELREKFQEEEGARKLLEGHMQKITQEVTELKNSFETAEKEKIEALTKLQVLSNYFKEKESQLQKELGLQESMWLQKQSDDHTIYEQMRSLREENEKYKLQNESLKKEIVEQESSFKIQLANVEQKSHENWVASRQAERRLKEVQQEAAQLRNRLTTNSATYSLDESKQNISESNGDPSSPPPSLIYPPTASPPFMMYPMPPHGDFVPPPPLMGSPYPSDSRPPPLGRISSPPLDHRFSPPPPLPYPPYDYPPYGHHSPSPPPPLPSHSHHRTVHKPQPRDMSREQKDHVMSNYSPESEKTIRRNKR
ncbi:transport and Golgi organization protein 1 isoform X2 [Homalodisca vitripennis]|uniref:transport and Golgi organization protein 1 isoform X2 n=1 Tax=Homalodisca vitripennis TaxID=197043 RepID=UPI001EEBB91F|nr:transport and Golgi organization protein 1 isoform X2 [Homalodisca vitripennis]